MKRFLRGSFIVFWGLVLLFLGLHGVENWRGERAWKAWKQAREAAGDRYGWPDPPPPVPDAENFAAVPEVARACRPGGQPFIPSPALPDRAGEGRGWRHGEREDLAAWTRHAKAANLAEVMAPAAPALEALAVAARRPHCRLPHDPRKGELPALLGFRAAGRVLRLRALDHLAQGRPAEAREDLLTVLRTARHLQSDPALISAILSSTLPELALQPLWEGLAEGRWREEDLKALEAALADLDHLQAFSRAWRTERMGLFRMPNFDPEQMAELPFWKRGKALGQVFMLEDPPLGSASLAFLAPRGWIHQNLLTWDRLWVEHLEPCLDPGTHRFHPERAAKAQDAVAAVVAKGRHPYNLVAAIAIPALIGQNEKAALRQTAVDQARVACALERFRMARKDFPQALEELVPDFLPALPVDVAAGGPLRYRREGSGYVLYALGSDGRDEGGRTVPDPKQPAAILADQGDWAWRMPGR